MSIKWLKIDSIKCVLLHALRKCLSEWGEEGRHEGTYKWGEDSEWRERGGGRARGHLSHVWHISEWRNWRNAHVCLPSTGLELNMSDSRWRAGMPKTTILYRELFNCLAVESGEWIDVLCAFEANYVCDLPHPDCAAPSLANGCFVVWLGSTPRGTGVHMQYCMQYLVSLIQSHFINNYNIFIWLYIYLKWCQYIYSKYQYSYL